MFIRTKGTEIKTAPELQLNLSPFCSVPHPPAFLPAPIHLLYDIYQLCFPANIPPPGKVCCWPLFPPLQSCAFPASPSLVPAPSRPTLSTESSEPSSLQMTGLPWVCPTRRRCWRGSRRLVTRPSPLCCQPRRSRGGPARLAASCDAFNSLFSGGGFEQKVVDYRALELCSYTPHLCPLTSIYSYLSAWSYYFKNR